MSSKSEKAEAICKKKKNRKIEEDEKTNQVNKTICISFVLFFYFSFLLLKMMK